MNKKQKKVLIRIIVAAVLVAVLWIIEEQVELAKWISFLMYLVPYRVIG